MSMILKEIYPVAQKEHYDSGAENILNSDVEEDLEHEDLQTLLFLKGREWKIPKGEKHIYQVGIFDGDFFAVRISFMARDIIVKYNLYDNY